MGRRIGGEERGAYAILFAVLIVALFIFSAMAVDLAAARAYVRDNRTRVDGAIAAAGNKLATDPLKACRDAWAYILANTDELRTKVPAPISPCESGVPEPFENNIDCDPISSPAVEYEATGEEPFDIIFTWPVPDDHPEMQGQTPGVAEIRPSDGTDPCLRFGITIRRTEGALFGGVLGPLINLNSPASAVVRTNKTGETEVVVALLLLDPVGCVALSAQGGGNSGGVIVFPSGTTPGVISVDSDGTDGDCNGENNVTLDANGAGTKIWACGPDVDADAETCDEGGLIELYSMQPAQASCDTGDRDACDPDDVLDGLLIPQPLRLLNRLTRSPADHRWNCQDGYPAYHVVVPIADCPDPEDDPGSPNADGDDFTSDYIDELVAYVGSIGNPDSTVWTTLSGDANCTIDGTLTLIPGNYFFDCPRPSGLLINGTLTVEGGNVITRHGIRVNGTFNMNTSPDSSVLPDSCKKRADDGDADTKPERPLGACPSNYSADHTYLYVRDGQIERGTGSTVNWQDVFVYAHDDGDNDLPLNFTGGGGTVTWISPHEGPYEDLNLWSESEQPHRLTGGASQTLDGVFFTPDADEFTYSGSGSQDQTNAQFLTYRMTATGNGALKMAPDPERALLVPFFGYLIIR